MIYLLVLSLTVLFLRLFFSKKVVTAHSLAERVGEQMDLLKQTIGKTPEEAGLIIHNCKLKKKNREEMKEACWSFERIWLPEIQFTLIFDQTGRVNSCDVKGYGLITGLYLLGGEMGENGEFLYHPQFGEQLPIMLPTQNKEILNEEQLFFFTGTPTPKGRTVQSLLMVRDDVAKDALGAAFSPCEKTAEKGTHIEEISISIIK